jgi:hypothetical protein
MSLAEVSSASWDRGDEDPGNVLRELGLLELSEKQWLRLPQVQSAADYVAGWKQQLPKAPAFTAIDQLRILDTSRPPTFYRDRWCDPQRHHTGLYVARRPQRYGSAIWCVINLDRGAPKAFKDLNSPGDRLRPCDIAWRIQCAMDAMAGTPQVFRRMLDGASTTLLFFSPLPSWAERHLSIVGRKMKAERSLFSYEMPNAAIHGEIACLRELLWMKEQVE